jgi:Ca2+-binding RTX toxin-like protein
MATKTGTANDDTLTGTSGADTLYGLAGHDILRGAAGDDRIEGGDGHDRLYGDSGGDLLIGGAGSDFYYIDSLADEIVETAGNGTDRVYAKVSFNLAGLSIEQLTLSGTARINATGNSAVNTLIGNAAANVIDGGGNADVMRGRGGSDTYKVDHAGDQVIEVAGEGSDTVLSAIDYTIGDFVENLTLTGAATQGTGNALANILVGNAAANVLNGGAGADQMRGGAGNDSYRVDNAGDTVVEASGKGSDTVLSSASFKLGDNVETLTLTGSAAIDGTGNALANTINGNSAANAINGGAGIDTLTGGGGTDRFTFTAAPGSANADRITDFTVGQDLIVLGGAAGQPFAALASGALGAGAFALAAAPANADDRIIYDYATGALYYDADGSGSGGALRIATLAPSLNLNASSFTVSGPANHLPTISSPGTASVDENVPTSTIVYQTLAQDADGDRIVYRLSGADAARFQINQDGAVRLLSSPNFETKSSYDFTVTAIDSSGLGASCAVHLTVTNVAEGLRVINETSGANDSLSSAQALARNLFVIAEDPKLPDDSLPSLRIEGGLSSTEDLDHYSVVLKEGELLILDVDGTPTLDSMLRVYLHGSEVTANDDLVTFDPGSTAHPGVSHNQDSFVRFRAPQDGTYVFSIAAFADENGPTTSGPYQINVSIGPVVSQAEIHAENVDALLSGEKWSDLSLSYGFPTSPDDYGPGEGSAEIDAGMEALNTQQQAAVRTILTQIARLTNLSFTEAEAAPGTAQLRYALTGGAETAHASYPGSGDGGDSWYNAIEYDHPVVGNYEWTTFIHETGHALGLKHGHESPAISGDRDSMEYSVMTYRSYVGAAAGDDGGYTNETWGFAQTPMMYDIAALQRLYGADFSANSGNNVYSWSPTSGAFMIDGVVQWSAGANRIFMTLWDGGGTDTYDFSNYPTHVEVDLRPGEWTITSQVQIAHLGDGHMARGNIANALLHNGDPRSLIENAIGTDEGDEFTANQAVNRLTGGGGGDVFRFHAVSDSPRGGADTITDFESGTDDSIVLAPIDANPATGANDAFSWLNTAAFSGAPGQLRWEARADGVHVFGDVNGDKVADLEIILAGETLLIPSDFVL